ncbi:hypothetical protein [Flagellimonas sp.]|uniref:hypothetical protein n=1 Tax=Flagellimonas sp. TaxID=2058762 RepID=UPI003F49E7F7
MKKMLGFLLFAGLILFKVSGFHVYTHHHDDCDSVENCEICDLVLENQTSDLDIPSPSLTGIQEIILINNALLLKPESLSTDSGINLLFSRPPPQVFKS